MMVLMMVVMMVGMMVVEKDGMMAAL